MVCVGGVNTHHFGGFVLVVFEHGDNEEVFVAVQPAVGGLVVAAIQLQDLHHVARAVVQHWGLKRFKKKELKS